MARGFNHVNYYTNDLAGTRDFYHRILGFEIAKFVRNRVEEGGEILLLIFDVGDNEHLSFMEPKGVEGIELAPRGGLGLTHHISFELPTSAALFEMRDRLVQHGVPVSPVVDTDYIYSIHLEDPVNNLLLEFSAYVHEFVNSADLTDGPAVRVSQIQQPQATRGFHGDQDDRVGVTTTPA